jgi:hypothetical protein
LPGNTNDTAEEKTPSESKMIGCGQTSAIWFPSTMQLPLSTRPSASSEKRSSAFIRDDSGLLPIHFLDLFFDDANSLIEPVPVAARSYFSADVLPA